jgi:hypothetical protein
MEQLLQEEYKAKWQYVMHTETLQSKYVQWYFGVVAAVLAFTYGGGQGVSPLMGGPWAALTVLAAYSVLVSLRLLVQKRNYDTYTRRLRQIEGQSDDTALVREKFLSVFKLQYYAVVLVGAVVVFTLALEATGGLETGWDRAGVAASVFGYVSCMLLLSFTSLVGHAKRT